MVASLPMPDFDDIKIMNEVVLDRQNGKNRFFFSDYQAKWAARLEEYVECAGNPVTVKPSEVAENDKGKFIGLYLSPKKEDSQYEQLKTLRNTKILYCPSCGEDGNPETLDHHLPKNEYPEFSIFSRNLVPMCGRCQRKKSAKVLDENGNRQFLHPYYDNLDIPVLAVKVNPPYSRGTTFIATADLSVPNSLKPVVENHVRELNIAGRLNDFCIEKYMQLLKTVKDEPVRPRVEFSIALRFFLRLEEKKAKNAWAAVFYRAVLQDQELMHYLKNDELPDYL